MRCSVRQDKNEYDEVRAFAPAPNWSSTTRATLNACSGINGSERIRAEDAGRYDCWLPNRIWIEREQLKLRLSWEARCKAERVHFARAAVSMKSSGGLWGSNGWFMVLDQIYSPASIVVLGKGSLGTHASCIHTIAGVLMSTSLGPMRVWQLDSS